MSRYILVVVATASFSIAAISQPAKVVDARQAMMRDLERAIEKLRELTLQPDAYDPILALEMVEAIEARAGHSLTRLYPTYSVSDQSAANRKIWSRWIIFAANADALRALAIGTSRQIDNRGATAKAVKAMQNICSGCHETFTSSLP